VVMLALSIVIMAPSRTWAKCSADATTCILQGTGCDPIRSNGKTCDTGSGSDNCQCATGHDQNSQPTCDCVNQSSGGIYE
jgi:hypothetical protein